MQNIHPKGGFKTQQDIKGTFQGFSYHHSVGLTRDRIKKVVKIKAV